MAAGSDPIEPVPEAPAAVVDTRPRNGDPRCDESRGGDSRHGERALVVADYHAGLEVGLRREGVSVPSHAADRRERLHALLDETRTERVVFLGDLAHAIGDPGEEEREELEILFETLTERVSVVVVKGNHDGGMEEVVERAGIEDVRVTPTEGVRLGAVGFAHGHTWPASDVVEAPTVCIGHEHPTVRLTDSVGGRRVEPIWLRGPLDRRPFDARSDSDDDGADAEAGITEPSGTEGGDDVEHDGTGSNSGREPARTDGELVVFPAFNDLVGGTWVNVPEQGFLSPFLPETLFNGKAYLLDGTRLGDYRRV